MQPSFFFLFLFLMNKQRIAEITLLVALIPALLGYYANYKGRWIISLFCYSFSFFILLIPPFLYVAFKCIQHCLPLISRMLVRISNRTRPIINAISKNKVLGPCVNLVIRCHFFVIFMTLLMSDQLIRKLLSPFIPEHATKRHLCKRTERMYFSLSLLKLFIAVINVGDAKFFRLGNHHHQTPPKSTRSFENEKGFKRPQYSLSIAHTLCIASKLAYEDVDVVKYELEQAGYLNSFKPIGYKVKQRAQEESHGLNELYRMCVPT